MSAVAPESAPVTARWVLSDDDDYVDDIQSEEEFAQRSRVRDREPEKQLKEEVDKLIARIKELLKGDNFSVLCARCR